MKPRPTVTQFMDMIQVDKKAEAGKVRFVLPKKIGEVVITREWGEQQLQELLADDPRPQFRLSGTAGGYRVMRGVSNLLLEGLHRHR